ncbi:MAG: hypothetical protein K2G28_10830 [Acetatifactor sp.]|nr:hypothetical protein [Acetatifactor sp.]MDE7352673.1 hypothetical protein [Acetatifactor sp.]
MSVLLLYPSNEIVRTWHRFYALDKGEVELLVAGSSHAYATFDPAVISRTTGMNCYLLTSVMSKETARQYAQAEYNPSEWVISEVNQVYFHKLAQLCQEEGILFYVVMAPMYDVYIRSINYDSCTDKIKALAESEGVLFLDCNLHYDEIGLTAVDFEDAFNGYHHLNGAGAQKVTEFVMETLFGQS